ncbi:MAG: hypothetical protein RR184_05600 [Citrobacter sp.]|jgi:dipeptide transport system substrate-binding protein|uniref:hypothetical protein n=1 Tax=Citrobacter sp. TaxID=1896336 RepID=UPI002FC86266
MENPHCNSVAYVNGIPILLTPTRPGKKQKRPGGANPLQRVKQQTSHLEQKNEYFLEEVRDAEAWSEPGGYDRCSKRTG